MKGLLNQPIYEKTLKDDCHGEQDQEDPDRVQQRAAGFEHTNKIAAEAADEELRLREEKNERLRKLRLALSIRLHNEPLSEPVRKGHVSRSTSEHDMDQTNIETSTAGARLREARISKNYSLEDLAIATGLTGAEIAAVEDRSSDAADHAERIEHALG